MPSSENATGTAVSAVVNDDGTAVVTVEGISYRIVAGNPEDAGAEALGYIAATVAGPAGTGVVVRAVRGGDHSMIVVKPDGSVEPVGESSVDAPPTTMPTAPQVAAGLPVDSGGYLPHGALDAQGTQEAQWGPPPSGSVQPGSGPLPDPGQPGSEPLPASDQRYVQSASEPLPASDQLASGPLPASGEGYVQSASEPPPTSDQGAHAQPAPTTGPTPMAWAGSPRHGVPPHQEAGQEPPPQYQAAAPWPPSAQAGAAGPDPAGYRGPDGHAAPPLQTPAWHPPPPTPPTLEDLLASRPAPMPGPAQRGFRGGVRRLSGGLIKPAPNAQELAHRKAIQAVQRSLNGPKTVVVINTKGGGGKTTATYCLAATFGTFRGGYVLAWDNNETRGTLAWRAARSRHTNTAVTLLRDLNRFENAPAARVGDLDNYVRGQGDAQFDVLASDEDAASAASIDAAAFRALHASLARFYRVMLIDTGNNIKASNWQAAVEAADQLVIVSSIREDTAGGASWTLDSLMESGHGDKVASAVTVLSSPSKVPDNALVARFEDHFRRRTRAVLRVPYDRSLVDGGPIGIDALSAETWEAWLMVAAAIADNL